MSVKIKKIGLQLLGVAQVPAISELRITESQNYRRLNTMSPHFPLKRPGTVTFYMYLSVQSACESILFVYTRIYKKHIHEKKLYLCIFMKYSNDLISHVL